MEPKKKEGRYLRIIDQLSSLLTATDDTLARKATINAVLHHKMEYFFWTGFYLLREGELTVGPYQGPVACQVLAKNTGVCWAAINEKRSLIVPDVHEFPGHIACDSRSRSEIALPLFNTKGEVYGVMDVDSKELNSFDESDQKYLEQIIRLINP